MDQGDSPGRQVVAKVNTRSPYEPEKHGQRLPVVIRPAIPDDAEAIAPIDIEREAKPADELVPLIHRALTRIAHEESPTRYTCVAIVDDRIVGYGKCKYNAWSEEAEGPELPDGWYLSGVEVLRSHRRRGMGRSLTIHRIDWVRTRADTVYYFTGERNIPSQDLHRGLGFVELVRGVAIPLPPPFSNEERHVLSRKSLR